MYQCPIMFYKDNLIFNIDRSAWAVYKLTGFDYDFLDDESKIKILYRTARFLAGVLSEAQILLIPVEQDSRAQFMALRERIDKTDPLFENAMYHAAETERYLRQRTGKNGDSNDYCTYLIVKLSEGGDYELADNWRKGLRYLLQDPVNAINVAMSLDTRDILESRLEQAQKTAGKWFYRQNQKIRLSPVETQELQWLIRRMGFRGLKGKVGLYYADQEKKPWQPAYEAIQAGEKERLLRPYGKDIVSLFSGTIYQENRCLRIVHDRDRVSYQTFLPLTNIPEAMECPGNEWIYMLQQMNLQVEACIHISAVEYRSALRKVERKKQEMDGQIDHINSARAEIPDDLMAGKEYADLLEAEIKGQNAPILNTGVTICLASDSLEELEKKTATVRGIYEDLSFGIERPLADQMTLFMQCIPSMGYLTRDYRLPLTPLTLSSGVIGATHELGDRQGPFIGTTGPEEKYVYLDMGRACLLDKSASATFYGNLGVGKSFNANLLLVLNVLYGGYGLIFDPKGERSHWEKELTVLEGMITTVTLSPKAENQGKMDPYNMYPDEQEEADELALNIISELLKIQPASMEYTAILEAQRKMREAAVPSMRRLIDILRDFPEEDELKGCARFLARRLSLQADSGMSRLLFGDGSEEAIKLENRLNILQIENLKLPSPATAKESYTNDETLSTVLMAVASHFAKKFALVKRPVFKVILFDESWMLGKTVEGVKLFDYLTRMGRSIYTGCIFNGHSVLDIPSEGIKNTISYKFCFQTTNDSEAARMCEYMELEPTQENKEILKNLGNGECLFQDLDRHVGVLRFDAVFQDLIEVFSTTPKTDVAKKDCRGAEDAADTPIEDITETVTENISTGAEPEDAAGADDRWEYISGGFGQDDYREQEELGYHMEEQGSNQPDRLQTESEEYPSSGEYPEFHFSEEDLLTKEELG